MKPEGVTRPVDRQGRAVIPMEIRRRLNIHTGDLIEFFTENNRIILRKYETQCIICSRSKDVQTVLDKPICADCLAAIKKDQA